MLLQTKFCLHAYTSFCISRFCSRLTSFYALLLPRCQKAPGTPVPRSQGPFAPWVHYCGTSIYDYFFHFLLSLHLRLFDFLYFNLSYFGHCFVIWIVLSYWYSSVPDLLLSFIQTASLRARMYGLSSSDPDWAPANVQSVLIAMRIAVFRYSWRLDIPAVWS